MRDILVPHEQPIGGPLTTHGRPTDDPWVWGVHGSPVGPHMGRPWGGVMGILGEPVGCPWAAHQLSMEHSWVAHGSLMKYPSNASQSMPTSTKVN